MDSAISSSILRPGEFCIKHIYAAQNDQTGSLDICSRAHYVIYWVKEGSGFIFLDQHWFEIVPGRVFFIFKGDSVFPVSYPADAWVIRFSESLFHEFLKVNPRQELVGLFDPHTRMPFADMKGTAHGVFNNSLDLLFGEIEKEQYPSRRLISNLLSIVLLYINQFHWETYPLVLDTASAGRMRMLKKLIHLHFFKRYDVSFYADQLGISAREVNELCREFLGKPLTELIADRLLAESELLLSSTELSASEIAGHLNFESEGRFVRFFKRRNGVDPEAFREQMGRAGEGE